MKSLYLHINCFKFISVRSYTQPLKSFPGPEAFPADILWKFFLSDYTVFFLLSFHMLFESIFPKFLIKYNAGKLIETVHKNFITRHYVNVTERGLTQSYGKLQP